MEQNVLLAFGLTMIAGLATGIGSLVALLAKRTNRKFLCASLGFSAGVMLYVSFMELMPEAKAAFVLHFGNKMGTLGLLLAFFGGMGLITLIDFLIPEDNNPHELQGVEEMEKSGSRKQALHRTGIVVALSLTIHNFPEGIATFTSALSGLSVAIPITIAIAIHNIPEGIAVSVPIYHATGNKRKAFWLSFLSGLAEPFGALMAYLFLMPLWSPIVNGIVLAAVAGIMVYISLDELLPTAEKYGEHHISISGLIAGMIIMAASLFFFINNKIGENDNFGQVWDIFRGNTSLTAYSDVSLPDNPVLLWSFKSDSYTKSSPVVHDQTAYWSNKRGRIFGVNIEGKQVFDYAMETAVDATPMIYNSVLYIGRIDGNLSAISLTGQNVLWNFETSGQIAASPNRISFKGQEVVIIGSYDNYLYCIDSKDGKEITRYKSGYYINGAVAQTNNFIVYGGCDAWFRVVDCISGMQTDSLEMEAYIPASPAISNNWCYIADYAGNVYEIKLNKGKIVSHKKIIESQDESGTFVSVPAVSDKMVYVVSNDRHIYALNRKDGSMAWKYLLKGNTGESSPVVCKDKLLVCTKTGIVSIHDAKKGDLLWEYDTGEQIIASPAVTNGCFYILTFKGTLFCFG